VGALGSSLYPDLMEFEEAMRLYQAGDLERARRGFRHLAELGDPEARLNLGVMLVKGEGGAVDAVEGTAWIRWAAESGAAGAQQVLPIVEGRLDEAGLADAQATLTDLRAAHSLENLLYVPDPAAPKCDPGEMVRPPPEYPYAEVLAGRLGYVRAYFLIDPEGNLHAAQAMEGMYRDDRFGPAAEKVLPRWRVPLCRSDRYVFSLQTIEFRIEGEYPPELRQTVAGILSQARKGDPGMSYIAGLLGATMDELFSLQPGEREQLLLNAAVAGRADARYELSLPLRSGDHDFRWVLLAARQGHTPALLTLYARRALPNEERLRALLQAANSGFVPAVWMAVAHLAAHPDEVQRDGSRALELIDAFGKRERARMRNDTSLREAHAMALAETGQFRQAAQLQRRVVSAARRLGRDTTRAEARLARYEANEPWRDPLLAGGFGTADDD
jgi:hypothetical protein